MGVSASAFATYIVALTGSILMCCACCKGEPDDIKKANAEAEESSCCSGKMITGSILLGVGLVVGFVCAYKGDPEEWMSGFVMIGSFMFFTLSDDFEGTVWYFASF